VLVRVTLPWVEGAIFEMLEDPLQWQTLTLGADIQPKQLSLLCWRPWLLAPSAARILASGGRGATNYTFHQSIRRLEMLWVFGILWMPRRHQSLVYLPIQRQLPNCPRSGGGNKGN
jgi:hypothetical protein